MDKKILNNIGEKNKQVNLLKVKINKFLIEYFNYIIFLIVLLF